MGVLSDMISFMRSRVLNISVYAAAIFARYRRKEWAWGCAVGEEREKIVFVTRAVV